MSAKSTFSLRQQNLPEVANSEEQIYESVHPPSSVLEEVVTETPPFNVENDQQTEVKKVNETANGDESTFSSSSTSEPPASVGAISAKIEPNTSMSLYGSNEELVFSTSSNYSDYGIGVAGQPTTTFWKKLLLVIMAPYALVGVPIASILHLADNTSPERIHTAKAWLHFLFSTPLAKGVNGCELLLVLLLNVYILFLFATPLYSLLINRQMTERLITLSVHLYEIIPLVYGLNIVWFKGFSLSAIIRLLDVKVMPPSAAKDGDGSWTNRKLLYGSLAGSAIAYGAHMLATLASVLSYEWKAANFYVTEARGDFYYHLLARYYLFLLVPVYLTIVSGLHFRIGCLNTYIRSLSDDLPSIRLQDFQRVKNVFKANADMVCKVNYVFNLLLSDILLIVLINIGKDIFQLFMLVAAMDSITISLDSVAKSGAGGVHVADPEMVAKATKWMALDGFVVIAKCALLILTTRRLASTNREIKRILSYLHDLASQYIEKPSDIYQSFCLVKYYIKARNERIDKPAVLRLSITKYLPCCGN